MSWQQYVTRHKAGRSQAELADLVEVSQTAVSRWLKGSQGVDAAVAIRFARAVGEEPLTALIEAGYLTPEEAGATPAGQPDYSQLSNDELLKLVRERMREDGGSGGDTAAKTPAGLDPAPDAVVTESMTPDERPAGGASPGPTRKTRGQGWRG